MGEGIIGIYGGSQSPVSERWCVVPSGEHTGPSLLESANPAVLDKAKLHSIFQRPDLFAEYATWLYMGTLHTLLLGLLCL